MWIYREIEEEISEHTGWHGLHGFYDVDVLLISHDSPRPWSPSIGHFYKTK
jgi:hypothetical protein